jgi:hypothetical protein
LGFLVLHSGVEANPDKVKAIEEMRPPRNLKEMQRLAGCMAALGRFIARSGEGIALLQAHEAHRQV